MKITSTGKAAYELRSEDGGFAGCLIYTNDSLTTARLQAGDEYTVTGSGQGLWTTQQNGHENTTAVCRVAVGGCMLLNINGSRYLFKKPQNWKPRFALLNAENEEVLALLPMVNWQNQSYDFTLQLNGEYIGPSDFFIILQALHCAVCSMAMMNGIIAPTVADTV